MIYHIGFFHFFRCDISIIDIPKCQCTYFTLTAKPATQCFICAKNARTRFDVWLICIRSNLDSLYQHAERFASWSSFFSFEVSELFSFLQSLHVCLFRRGCWKPPRFADFMTVFLFETTQAIGMALLFGSVCTCLSVRSPDKRRRASTNFRLIIQAVHGVLITNCLYSIPVLFNVLSRKPDKPKRVAKMTMEGFAFLAQLNGCLHWTLIWDTTALLRNSYDSSFIQSVDDGLVSSSLWQFYFSGGLHFQPPEGILFMGMGEKVCFPGIFWVDRSLPSQSSRFFRIGNRQKPIKGFHFLIQVAF